VTETVKDSFATEARAFVEQWDRLNLVGRKSFGDIPDAAIVRPVISQAEFLWMQRDNPFRDFTLPQLQVIDFAGSFLRWLPDPGNPERWDSMFAARVNIDDEYPWDFDPDA
jgi:hypothetical protein